MPNKYLIVGGVAGGASTAARLRRLGEEDEIIMFERGPHVSFSNCCLPYYLSGTVEHVENLVLMNPEKFKKQYNIDARVNNEVVGIDRAKKEVEVKDLVTGGTYRESYDKLVLSPGARPVVPPIPGIEKAHIFTIRNVVDIDNLHRAIQEIETTCITMVAGGITGVGIWFTIALLNPAATSVLIHNYVFGWATEWVFFLIEIISLFIYAYTFGRLDKKTHLVMGWIYFGAAWMSLFIINGIIDFMLTPGAWLENHNFWSGFFNPTFWPALFFRTFLALIIAGLFGLLTSTRIQEEALRKNMVRHCALYLVIPFLLLLGSAWWYKAALPPELQTMIFQTMPEMKPFVTGFIYFSVLLMAGGLLMAELILEGTSASADLAPFRVERFEGWLANG